MSARDEVYIRLRDHSEQSAAEIRRAIRRGENTVRVALRQGVALGYYKSNGSVCLPKYTVCGPLPDEAPVAEGPLKPFTEDEKLVLWQLVHGSMTVDNILDHLDLKSRGVATRLMNTLRRNRGLVVVTYTLTERGKRVVARLDAEEASHAAE